MKNVYMILLAFALTVGVLYGGNVVNAGFEVITADGDESCCPSEPVEVKTSDCGGCPGHAASIQNKSAGESCR